MKKYRSRITCEAFQFDPAGLHNKKLPEGITVAKHPDLADNYGVPGFRFEVKTLRDYVPVTIRAGDWLARGQDGGLWNYSNEEFEKNFEAIE